jgi:hypothetical protein
MRFSLPCHPSYNRITNVSSPLLPFPNPYESIATLLHQIIMADSVAPNPSNPVVFFDIALAGMRIHEMTRTCKLIPSTGEPLGRVKMELFAHVTPRTAENFRQFCTGESKNSKGQPQGYKGSKFHRVVCALRCKTGHGADNTRSKIS